MALGQPLDNGSWRMLGCEAGAMRLSACRLESFLAQSIATVTLTEVSLH